jgi:iron complex transport system ATP-binding protein
MDEPTANLDYGNQYRVMERVAALADEGYTVIFSTHDPNLAFIRANRVLAIKDGRIMAEGRPRDVLSEAALSSLYNIGVILRDVEYGGRHIAFHCRRPADDFYLRLR